VKHDYVEQRELGCMTQLTKEKKIINFVARDMKEKEGGGKEVPPIMERMADASSIGRLHHEVVDERGSPITSSKKNFVEGYAGRDPASIIDFCRYAMAIYGFQLTNTKPENLGCTHEEVVSMHEYLRMQHQSNTWVDDSQGRNFLALIMH